MEIDGDLMGEWSNKIQFFANFANKPGPKS